MWRTTVKTMTIVDECVDSIFSQVVEQSTHGQGLPAGDIDLATFEQLDRIKQELCALVDRWVIDNL